MWVWVGPKWMRPGGRAARVMWLVSLPVAAVMIGLAWTSFGHARHAGTPAFLVVWTVLIVGIEAVNFRTLYLGRGRRADAVNRALADEDER
ncbi:MAG: hypothetical protein ACXVX0_19350 [Blastococcus sp.]